MQGTCGILIEKSEFSSSVAALEGNSQTEKGARSTNETITQIEALLSAPLNSLALRVLEIPSWGKLMSSLPWGNWKEVSEHAIFQKKMLWSIKCDVFSVRWL
jgi:hypothetical protein